MPPLKSLEWSEKEYIQKAPIWCSVDLRDGNQALITPMSLEEKIEFFSYLFKLGLRKLKWDSLRQAKQNTNSCAH